MPVKRGVAIQTHRLPAAHYQTCAKRVQPLLRHWGQFCDVLTMEQLALSCYTQGFADAVQVVDAQVAPAPINDFQI